MATLSTIGLDADDTLWQSEQFFKLTEARFVELLSGHTEGADLSARLLQVEMKNLEFYGFGIKSFVLSMIETGGALTRGHCEQLGHELIEALIAAGGHRVLLYARERLLRNAPHLR